MMDYKAALEELLVLIVHEDAAYVEGGSKKLDEAAWRIARQLPEPPEVLCVYLRANHEDEDGQSSSV